MSNSPNGSQHSSSGRENPSGYASATGAKRRNSRESPMAFYEIPSWVPNVPSKIINDAKQSLKEIPTSRPYTPRDESRYSLSKLKHEPASFHAAASVDYEIESRPTSSKPIETKRRSSKGHDQLSDPPGSVIPARLSKLQPQLSQDSSSSSSSKPPLPSSSQARSSASTTRRLGSSTTSKVESSDETLLWKNEINPLIEALINAYQKSQFDEFDRISVDLYNALHKHHLFDKKSNKRRAEILKTLFTFIESENSLVKFHVARLSLAFQVSSVNNLRNVVRLTTELSTNKDDDHFFSQSNLLDLLFETITRLDLNEHLDSLVYFCTTLKNLTVNNELVRSISARQPFELLKVILKHLLQLKDQAELVPRLCDCLAPLTETLRNLAEHEENRREYLADDLIDPLTSILKYFTEKSHSDLMMNVARIFSKLTLHTDCCLKLVQCSSCYRSFLKILIKHENNQALVVRVCFILGNMLAKSENARLTFMNDSRALQTLTKLLQSYIQLDSLVLKPEKLENDDSTSQDLDLKEDPSLTQFRSIENIIKKVIRVLSNAAISPENGLIIIQRDECIDLLFKLLKAPNQHSEELLVHVLMALNNLSYYDDEQSYIIRHADTLAQLLVKYIRNEEKLDCVVEAFRVLGNLSRTKRIRDRLMKCEVDRLAIHYSQSDNVELLYAVIGVLINLTVDEEKRECLKIHHGIDSLINIFECSIQSDWQLSSLVCKALWNYCDNQYEKTDVQPLWFTDDQLKILFSLFEESLNEGSLETTDDEQLNELNKQLWNEEYFPVASRLYQRLAEGMEHFYSK